MFYFLVYHTSNVLIVWDRRGLHRPNDRMLILFSSKIVTFTLVAIEKKAITFSSSSILFFRCCVFEQSCTYLISIFFQRLFKSALKSASLFRGC